MSGVRTLAFVFQLCRQPQGLAEILGMDPADQFLPAFVALFAIKAPRQEGIDLPPIDVERQSQCGGGFDPCALRDAKQRHLMFRDLRIGLW